MIDVFDMYMNDKHIAVWHFDTETRKLSATLDSWVTENDIFPNFFTERVEHLGNGKVRTIPTYFADDERIRKHISMNVAPPDRENIDDILRALGLKCYDQWEIWRACEGRNYKDHTKLIYRETI